MIVVETNVVGVLCRDWLGPFLLKPTARHHKYSLNK